MSAIQNLTDYRSSKGKQYEYSFLIFCILLTELKNCRRQRQRSCWLEENFDWIKQVWEDVTNKQIAHTSPSQSTISRLLNNINLWALSQQYYKTLNKEKKLESSQKVETIKSPKQGNNLVHYAIDGKSRQGIVSPATGRTEIDVTIFEVSRREVVAHRTLPDKVGEAPAIERILKHVGRELASGIFTGDAAFTSPKLTQTIINTGHQYILGLKANAGAVYDLCVSQEWANFPILAKTENEDHGRKEVRTIKRLALGKFMSEKFSKYSRCAYLYCVESMVTKSGKTAYETRFFIGSRGLKGLDITEILATIRAHWMQENGLHWVKDAILDEDNQFVMSNRSSRVLGFFKNLTVSIGYKLFGSVQKFIDRFASNPRKYTFKLLYS